MSDWFSGSETAFFGFYTDQTQSLHLATVFSLFGSSIFFHLFYFYFTEVFTSFLQ